MYESGLMFVGVGVVILIIWMLWSLRKMTWKEKVEYLKSEDGKGILHGIGLAVGISFAVVILFMLLGGCTPVQTSYGSWNNGATVFAGLDYTNKVSPACDPVDPDSHTTSNLGLKYHVFKSTDKKFGANVKYTHHSCAFSSDRYQYDGTGLELEYKLW